MGSLAFKEVRRLNGNLVLDFTGTVDDGTVECFERGLDRAMRADSRQVVVDLSSCQLDSAGLAALVRLRRRSTGRSAGTRLVVPDVDMRRMLQIVGPTSQFPTYPTLASALHPASADAPIVAWSAPPRSVSLARRGNCRAGAAHEATASIERSAGR